jgi:cytosine/adenosine deaminase-related metal-dependent hydrolase
VFARRGKFLESFSRYRDHGVNMSLGTDTYPQDAFSMMHCAAGACNVVEGRPGAVTPYELFEAATLGGARALGRDDIGRLTSSAKADIICVNVSHLHTGTIENPIETLVTRCYGPDVDRVIVDGQTVVEDGSAVGADGDALKCDTVEVLERFVETFVEWDSEDRSSEELFPRAFEVREPPI